MATEICDRHCVSYQRGQSCGECELDAAYERGKRKGREERVDSVAAYHVGLRRGQALGIEAAAKWMRENSPIVYSYGPSAAAGKMTSALLPRTGGPKGSGHHDACCCDDCKSEVHTPADHPPGEEKE